MRPPALASAVRVNPLEILALLAAALCASFVLAPACAADLIWEVENPLDKPAEIPGVLQGRAQ